MFIISHFHLQVDENGTYYLGKYLFLRVPVLTAKVKDMSDSDLALMLEKDRVKYNKNKPLGLNFFFSYLSTINNKKKIKGREIYNIIYFLPPKRLIFSRNFEYSKLRRKKIIINRRKKNIVYVSKL